MEARSQLRHRPSRCAAVFKITITCSWPYDVLHDMTRYKPGNILCEFTKSDSLRRHALAVEACVAAYARKFGEDEEKWSVTALLHDFDWEIHPELPDHPDEGRAHPGRARRRSDEIRRAILSHANYSGVPRDRCSKKRCSPAMNWPDSSPPAPTSSRAGAFAKWRSKSVRKKLKDKAFARSVNRDDILNGAAGTGRRPG